MSLFRKDLNEVFTPRNPEVNPEMYIQREELERDFRRAIEGTLHILIHGESGCGKSWLYKKVLNEVGAFSVPANLANASRLGSITNELANVVSRKQEAEKTEYTETKLAEGTLGLPGVAQGKGSLSHAGTFSIPQKEPLEACLEMARSLAGSAPCFIVMDNLEAIFSDQTLMKELGDIITLLDDPAYSKFKVKIIIVGIPAGVRDYFSRTPNRHAVSNRLSELPEIGKLSKAQAFELVRRGFSDELKVKFATDLALGKVQEHIKWITDGVPQCLHEYCLELAYLMQEQQWTFEEAMLPKADRKWLEKGLSKNYATIEELMNERDTRAGRRNQVLYSLGKADADTFRYSDIEQTLRSEFPGSTPASVTLDVPSVLAQLARDNEAPIKRTAKGDAYRFTDPRFKMCIRAMLVKNEEKVTKVDFARL